MPKIGHSISSEDALCPRCQSKRKVSKRWTEKIENAGGFAILEHTQIICTNKDCQAEFEKVIVEDNEKREKIKQGKAMEAAKRAAAKPAE
jgi:hypothetical protein